MTASSKFPLNFEALHQQVLLGSVLALGAATVGCDMGMGPGGGPPSPPRVAPYEVTVTPYQMTVQVGGTATFTGYVRAETAWPVKLQWCRQGRLDAFCIDIAGATGITYVLSGANLADDGAVFRLTATYVDFPGLSNWGDAQLAVSSMPALVYQDGDFADGRWQVTSFPEQVAGSPWNSVSRVASGGNPGAYQSVDFALQGLPAQQLRVYQIFMGQEYDPSIQGAVYLLNFSVDCSGPTSVTGGVDRNGVRPAIQQANRLYYGPPMDHYTACAASSWQHAATLDRGASGFTREDYPDYCQEVVACQPDFSATGSPMRFGFVTSLATGKDGDTSGANYSEGVDNWRVTIWRK